jgi:pimeloyl-ACP methyl ester carboxylesterase
MLGATPAHADRVGDCRVGAYALATGDVVDVAPTDGETLRWRRFDGATGALHEQTDGRWTSTLGWTNRADGIEVRFSCDAGTIEFGGKHGRRIPLSTLDTRFDADGTSLAGRLVLPPGKRPVAIAILVHGSEDMSALDFYAMQRMLPARGVGVFVYDKRGTGASAGSYTQDFERLAADAVAALNETKRLAGARARRIGYLGTSQGGWVAPLAARRQPVDFVIVGYGLAVAVIDEDREAVELEMRLKGHSPADIASALDIATAAENVFESGFTSGFAELIAIQDRYRSAPWFKDLHGNFTHFILDLDEARMRAMARNFQGWNTPFRYDPMPTLRALDTPQLWVLGADDLDAPSAETARRLRTLVGKPISIAMFPHAEHGITEYEIAADGSRVSTRYAPGYFEILTDYARDGRLRGAYGEARLEKSRSPKRSLRSGARPTTDSSVSTKLVCHAVIELRPSTSSIAA